MSDPYDMTHPYFDDKKVRPCCVDGKRQRPWPFTGRWLYEYVDLKESLNYFQASFGLPHGHGFTVTRARDAAIPAHTTKGQLQGDDREKAWGWWQGREGLCPRGHWTKLNLSSDADSGKLVLPPVGHPVRLMHLASAREADQMVRRLSVGGPVFRERWLGLGAALLVAATVVQAVAATL